MEQPKDKAALVAAVRRQRAFWDALLESVDEADMLTPGVTGDWTFKDVVAHLTGWRRRTVQRFEGARAGGQLPPPDWPAELGEEPEEVNPWIYQKNHDRPLFDVLAESRQVWQALVDNVDELPEEDLMQPGRYSFMDGLPLGPANLSGSFGHLHEHAALINDWLARQFDLAVQT